METSTIEDAIAALQAGKFVVVLDDKDRENEGDLILSAEKATEESIGFMIRYTSGILCVSMLEERLKALQLHQMVSDNTDPKSTAFTVSVDHLPTCTTGISSKERASTLRALANPDSVAAEFGRPGHIFPLRYRKGGVLKRAGHTEAAVDLMKLSGLPPVGVLSEIVNDDGSVARRTELIAFAAKHDLPLIDIADIVRYRRINEKLVERVSTARLPTKWGEFKTHVYRSVLDDIEHIALVKGDVAGKKDVLVRVHSECLTGDILGSLRCDCGIQLNQAMKKINDEGEGVLVYLRGHEGRGIGLGHKIRAYTLQDQGFDTVKANERLGLPVDSREYGIGAQILCDLGLSSLRLLTNNPAKYNGITGYDLKITERVPIECPTNPDNEAYMKTKREKLGHLLSLSQNIEEVQHV